MWVMKNEVVLAIKNLSVQYQSTGMKVENIDLSIARGKVLGLLGESGSGKSTVCSAVLGLQDTSTVELSGSICLLGKEILQLSWSARERVNGKEIGVVLQNPMTAFDPCMRIGGHFAETICTHLMCKKHDALLYGLQVLKEVGLADGERIMKSYPHELSGGMLQRIMVALAISLNPVLIIADEPTTALDASSQGVILDLLSFVMRKYRPAMLLISHDIDVMAALANDLIVMKDGRIVERGTFSAIMRAPQHPYTKELVAAAQAMEVDFCCR